MPNVNAINYILKQTRRVHNSLVLYFLFYYWRNKCAFEIAMLPWQQVYFAIHALWLLVYFRSGVRKTVKWINNWDNEWMNQSINESINQSMNQSINQSINQPINQSIIRTIDYWPIKENSLVSQSIDKSVRQSFSWKSWTVHIAKWKFASQGWNWNTCTTFTEYQKIAQRK